MFVGEVRWATTGAGSSWKLSGGRSCSRQVTSCRSSATSGERRGGARSTSSRDRSQFGRVVRQQTLAATTGRRAKIVATSAATARAAVAAVDPRVRPYGRDEPTPISRT